MGSPGPRAEDVRTCAVGGRIEPPLSHQGGGGRHDSDEERRDHHMLPKLTVNQPLEFEVGTTEGTMSRRCVVDFVMKPA